MHLVQCPYPECFYVADVLTNNHCRTVHNMAKSMLLSSFGPPHPLYFDPVKRKQNTYRSDALFVIG